MMNFNLLKKTTQNMQKPQNMDGLIMRTTNIPQMVIQQGVLDATKQGLPRTKTKVEAPPGSDAGSKSKTVVRTIGQVPYSGPMMSKGPGKPTGF